MIRAKAEVEGLTPYVAPLEGRRSLLRLDFNESTVGPSPRVLDAIRSLPPDAYAAYPEYAGLNAAFAETIGVPERHVEAFNGVDAAIRAIFDAYGEKGSTLLTTAPTFGYYEPCAQQQGMVQALREQRILVRSMAKKPVIDGSFRLTIGTLADMRRFVSAFSTIAAFHARSAR